MICFYVCCLFHVSFHTILHYRSNGVREYGNGAGFFLLIWLMISSLLEINSFHVFLGKFSQFTLGLLLFLRSNST